jgi:hypothetical protein
MKRDAAVDLPPFVAFIDGAIEGWQERARQSLDEGQNFFIVVADEQKAALAAILDLAPESLPAPETTAALLSSSRFIDQREFRLPNTRGDRPERIYHIEQLNLPRTHPPTVKLYLVYCYVRGIVSQHDLPSDARVGCDHYNNDRFARSHYPEAAVYRWEQTEWRRTRLC